MTEKKVPKVIYTFRTREKVRLEQYAKSDNRTVSNVVNLAVREFLARRTQKQS